MQTKINIIGLPPLAAAIGAASCIEWPGGTIGQMIDWLSERHGPIVKEQLCDDQGDLDPTIQVMMHEQPRIQRDRVLSHPLCDGDGLSFVLLAAGG